LLFVKFVPAVGIRLPPHRTNDGFGQAVMIVSDTPSAAAHRIDASSSVIPYGFGMPEIYAADGLGAAGAAARNISYDGEHKLAERLQLLPLWGLQGLPWHFISRWRAILERSAG
jgi:hypothetical protein